MKSWIRFANRVGYELEEIWDIKWNANKYDMYCEWVKGVLSPAEHLNNSIIKESYLMKEVEFIVLFCNERTQP